MSNSSMHQDVELNLLGRFYICFTGIVLSGAIFPLLKSNPQFAFLQPWLLYQISMVICAILGVYLLLPAFKKVVSRYLNTPLLTLLIIWMLLSLVWTIAPQSRINMAVGLITCTIFGTYLVIVAPRRDALIMLANCAFVVVAFSVFYTYVMSFMQDISPNSRLMAGIFSNKNILVRIACFSFVVAVYLAILQRNGDRNLKFYIQSLIWVMTVILALWVSAQYYTFTAKVAIPAAVGMVTLALLARYNQIWFLLFAALSVTIFVLFVIYLDEILLLARETSGLNNRFYHWSLLISQRENSIWIGAGLGGFWDRVSGSWQSLDLLAPLRHGHNGFIDTWLDLGLVGLLLMVANLVVIAVGNLKIPFKNWQLANYFTTATFVVFVIYNLNESSILPTNSANTFLWVIFVAMALRQQPIRDHLQ